MGCGNSDLATDLVNNNFEVVFRKLRPEDAFKAQELSQLSFPIYYPIDYFISSFGNPAEFHVVGYSSRNETDPLLGLMMAIPDYRLTPEKMQFCSPEELALISRFHERICYISLLAVHPCMMRRGFGSKMIQDLVRTCKTKENCPEIIFLHVKTDNFQAMKFYEKNGFQKDSFIKNYYNENSHAFIYFRRLKD